MSSSYNSHAMTGTTKHESVETHVETQDLASLRGTHQLVSLDFHINGHDLMGITDNETVGEQNHETFL